MRTPGDLQARQSGGRAGTTTAGMAAGATVTEETEAGDAVSAPSGSDARATEPSTTVTGRPRRWVPLALVAVAVIAVGVWTLAPPDCEPADDDPRVHAVHDPLLERLARDHALAVADGMPHDPWVQARLREHAGAAEHTVERLDGWNRPQ